MRVKKGFTFAEILVVTCIIAVVASVAMPAIDDFMSSQKISSEAELFVSSVREARYKAMQEGALHRLVFDIDESGNVAGYKIQSYGKYDSDTEEIWNLDDEETTPTDSDSTNKNTIDFKTIYINDSEWHSILDSDEIVFDTSIEVKLDSVNKKVIYFYPTGYLVRSQKPHTEITDYYNYTESETDNIADGTNGQEIISEETLKFTYGNSQGIVRFNAMGILSTEITEIDDGGGD